MMFGGTWLWLWFVFLFVWMVPTGYGWAYRGWGPPLPAYQRRRLAASMGPDHRSSQWGRFADLLWFLLFVQVVWLLGAGFWSQR